MPSTVFPDPTAPKRTAAEVWAHDLIDRILFGRRAMRLTPAEVKAHDVDYIAKGLGRREAFAITRGASDSERLHGALYGEAKVHYEEVAAKICDLLAADDPDGAEALLLHVITSELPDRVARHMADADLLAIA